MEGCEFWLEQLSARLDGELTSEEERELERHLVQCPDCRALSEQLEALSAGLQDLEEIIIDPTRCPETAREFTSYELDRDREGNFKAGFPDRNNHSIDAVRYACEEDMTRPRIQILR